MIRNLHIYRDDAALLANLAEEYSSMGWRVKLGSGMLTVFALPKKKKDRRDDDKNAKGKRGTSNRPSRDK